MRDVLINGYFRNQTVTGQQRFATEIANRVPLLVLDAEEVRPTRYASGRRTEWLEMQARIPLKSRGRVLASLTSRAPIGVREHLVVIHDLFPLTNPEWFSRPYAALHSHLLRAHLQHASAFAVVSGPIGEQVAEMANRDVPIVLTPNAVTKQLQRRGGPEGADEVHFRGMERPPRRYILTVGNLEPRKNLGRLLRAYDALPTELKQEVPLLIVGATSSAFAHDPIVGRTHPTGVQFLGRVPDTHLSMLYRHASVFVSASLDEGFGIPVLEAADLGSSSLVLSDIPTYRWLADRVDPIWIDPTDEASISWGLQCGIDQHLAGPSVRPSLSTRYSWDQSAEALVAGIDLIRY